MKLHFTQGVGVGVLVGVVVGVGVTGGPYAGAGPYNIRQQPDKEIPSKADNT